MTEVLNEQSDAQTRELAENGPLFRRWRISSLSAEITRIMQVVEAASSLALRTN